MAISPIISPARLTGWAQALVSRTRRCPEPASMLTVSDPNELRARIKPWRAIPHPSLYTLEMEEEEPTWEDAEWQ